jgi:hypothetical protein
MRAFVLLCSLLLTALPSVAAEAAPPLFQRIVVLGASVGAGFDTTAPFGGPKTGQYRFAHYLDAAVAGTHEPVTTCANVMLFLNATEIMEKQVTAAIAAKPSVVVGLDALFWFCYGAGRTPEKRLEFFETGLRFLERIDAPLIVGDLPDASRAVGGILGKGEMPPLETIAKCNERLKEWAAARPNVKIFPISEVMARAGADEELTIGGMNWPAGKSRALLQRDLLHPARHGLAALAIAVLDAAASPATTPVNLSRDLELVYAAAIERANADVPATPAVPK